MNECEEAFMRLNTFMATPPILTHPTKGTPLFIYLSVTNKVMRFVFIQEKDKNTEQPVHFINKVFKSTELRYHKIERLVLTVVIIAKKLRRYF